MTALPVWAGVIVGDLAASTAWYTTQLGCAVDEEGRGWRSLCFSDGSAIELHAGDRDRPGLVFPSYGSDPGPPVMAGYAVEEPDVVADGLPVARSLPDWIVVVAPDGLRLVLTARDGDGLSGLVGFRFASPRPGPQQRFFARIGVAADIVEGERAVVPIVAGDRDATLHDPNGGAVDVVRAG